MTDWKIRLGTQAATLQSGHARLRPMRIVTAGLCCSVGYNLVAASCAIRANMDHFQESEFVTVEGELIRVGRLPDSDVWGYARRVRWASFAIEECLHKISNPNPKDIPLIALLPKEHFPGDKDHIENFILDVENESSLQFASGSKSIPEGRAGLTDALELASRLLSQGAKHVMLIGSDSYLNAPTIEFYLNEERILVSNNRDGFIPAEAAAAILLEDVESDTVGIVIEGIGKAEERGRPDGSVPSRGQGLTDAVRSACESAGIHPTELTFRLSDQNGENFFAKEASNSFARLQAGGIHAEHLTLADKLGEIGAATGPTALAYLSHVMDKNYFTAGTVGTIHLANDSGERNAVVVRHRNFKGC